MGEISKITAFYYLEYPDNKPEDPFNAGSETYVELGDADSTEDHFITTRSVLVCTPRYLESRLAEPDDSLFLQSILLVSRFDDATVGASLHRHLQEIVSRAHEV